jgi:hypothetical protein
MTDLQIASLVGTAFCGGPPTQPRATLAIFVIHRVSRNYA